MWTPGQHLPKAGRKNESLQDIPTYPQLQVLMQLAGEGKHSDEKESFVKD